MTQDIVEEDPSGDRPISSFVPQWLKELARDAVVAFAIVAVILLLLWAVLGVWPPMVVVETGSMEHSESRSYVGVIDTGDMVFIKKVDSVGDVTTYVEARATGDERHFGDYGDVIVYRKWGSDAYTPVIHRAIAYLYYNETSGTFVVPGLSGLTDGEDYHFTLGRGSWGSSKGDVLVIEHVGYKDVSVSIDFSVLENRSNPHDGFITMGDNNSPATDQLSGGIINETVSIDWVIGKGVLELPWFGLVKLTFQGYTQGTGLPTGVSTNSWWSLGISLTVLVVLPFLVDFAAKEVAEYLRRRRNECPECGEPLDVNGECPSCHGDDVGPDGAEADTEGER